MDFSPLSLRGAPLITVKSGLMAEFARHLKEGDAVPGPTEGGRIFDIPNTTYSRALNALISDGAVTRVDSGTYAYGTPSAAQRKALVAEMKRKRKERSAFHQAKKNPSKKSEYLVTRAVRNEARAKIAKAILDDGIEKHIVRAIHEGDLVLMQCCEKALKMVGCTFDQSDEALKQMKDAGVNPTQNLTAINFNFVPADKGPNQAIEAEIVSEGPDGRD